VDLEVRVWIAEASKEKPVHARVVEAAKVALDAAGIEIPFPHLQLFVEQVEDRVWDKVASLRGNGGR
jgi:small-conductance mechanosensitive channel